MKKIIVLSFIFIISVSCSSVFSSMQYPERVKSLEVGMTLKQIESVMGKGYEVVSARDNFKVMEYAMTTSTMYHLYLENNLLTGWDKIILPVPDPGGYFNEN